MDRPDLSGRRKILEIYAKKVKLAEGVDLDQIAQATSGFAGADLANLVNEGALLAARANRTTVEQGDLNEAIERVVAGLRKRAGCCSLMRRKWWLITRWATPSSAT